MIKSSNELKKSYCSNGHNIPRLKFLDKTEGFDVGIFCRNKSTE
ncbi:hypothetical protein [Tissierella creatinophila]|nr:hypothetical protein [Tissierella creatinophila]